MQAVHLTISGRVQGVFFRAHTKETADKLGIKGYVRNTEDGNVEAVAVGDEEKIKEFIEWCKEGPDSAKVEDIKIGYPKVKEGFKGFEVRY